MKRFLAFLTFLTLLLVIASTALAEVKVVPLYKNDSAGGTKSYSFLLLPGQKNLYPGGNLMLSPVDVSDFDVFSIQFKCVSAASTPNVTIQWYASAALDVNTTASTMFSAPAGMSNISSNVTTETWSPVTSVTQLKPPVAPFALINFQENGLSAGSTDTTCQGYLILGR